MGPPATSKQTPRKTTDSPLLHTLLRWTGLLISHFFDLSNVVSDLFPSLFYGIPFEKRKINFQKPPAGPYPEDGCDMRQRIMLSFYQTLAKSNSEQNNKCYLAPYSIIIYALGTDTTSLSALTQPFDQRSSTWWNCFHVNRSYYAVPSYHFHTRLIHYTYSANKATFC